ncbi:RNA-binding S4 domain-containing protein [Maritalea sp.]|jgi:ribosome-associated heat shock protein Hsp15|uniref:RNA-binding S4 domain-containing protein n=1 Tax=Maritalea sp. TaxID=2003361 RepID=UPI0039E2E57F
MSEPEQKRRLDKWLWFARCVKTRTLAQKLVNGGHVRVNSERCVNPANKIKIGDVLTITLPRSIRILKIVGLGENRGSAPMAALLFEDLSPPPIPKSDGPRLLPVALREKGAGRPTKRQRRETDRLKQPD